MARFINNDEELSLIHDKLCQKLDEVDKILDDIFRLHKKDYLDDDAIDDFLDYRNGKDLIDIEKKNFYREYIYDFTKDINNRNARNKLNELKNNPLINEIINNSGQILLEALLNKHIEFSKIKKEGLSFNYISIDDPSAIIGGEDINQIDEDLILIEFEGKERFDIPIKSDRIKKLFSDNMEKINYINKDRIEYNNKEWDDVLRACTMSH